MSLCRASGLKSLCSPLAPGQGQTPWLLLCGGREITLIWSKVPVVVHGSPLFPCSWGAGAAPPPEHRACTVSSFCSLLEKVLRQGVPVWGQVFGTGGGQTSWQGFRVSREAQLWKGQGAAPESILPHPAGGNKNSLQVLYLTLNQQLSGAVTSPRSAAQMT